MITFYQRRATGETYNLVRASACSGLPIVVRDEQQVDFIKWTAQEHSFDIPEPIIAKEGACDNIQYLVDEAVLTLQKVLGGEIVAASVTDQGDTEDIEWFNAQRSKQN